MKHIFILGFCLVALVMCKKGIEEDKLFIRGRLFLLDTLTQKSNNVPLAKKRVVLSYDNGDSLNFLYSDTTDANGYFEFNLVAEKGKKYVARYEDSLSGHYYFAKSPVNGGDEQVVLLAQLNASKENGFIIHLVDAKGEAIPNVTMRLYNNKTLADQNDVSGAVEVFASTPYGLAFRLNIPAGTYYLNALKVVDTVNYLRLSKPILVAKTGFVTDTMLIPRKTSIVTNGFSITVTDSLGGTIPKATAYLYSSLLLALTNDPNGALNTFSSDSLGVVSKLNFPAGTYYLNAFKNVDTLKFKRIARVLTISSSAVFTDTIVVRKQ